MHPIAQDIIQVEGTFLVSEQESIRSRTFLQHIKFRRIPQAQVWTVLAVALTYAVVVAAAARESDLQVHSSPTTSEHTSTTALAAAKKASTGL
jgi:hypothetical protein